MPPVRPAHKNISPTTVIITFTLFIFISCSLINRQVNFYKIISTRLTNTSFDVYIFTLNWPPSVCLAWEEKGKGHTCMSSGNKTSWTIHGIWPTRFGEIGPNFCNNSLHFNPEAIYGIKDELEAAWSPVQKHKQYNSFWKHEWEKHGTCATTIPLYPNEFEYFNQGLKWGYKYNVTTVLSNAGIVPGRVYNVSAIWSTIKQAYGKNPHIVCFTDSVSKSSYILEIRMCFNKTLDIVDCDGIKYRSRWEHRRKSFGSSGNFTDCVPNQPVEYPITSPYPPPLPEYPKQDIFILDVLKFIHFLGWATS